MKTNKINQNNITFSSQNSYIRRTDSIMRKIKLAIPMHSPTYLQQYRCNKKNKNAHRYINALHIKINFLRDSYNSFIDDNSFWGMFETMKSFKIANCHEQSCLTKAVLEANGYKNVEICALMGFNKKRNKVIDYDHAFVVTDLKLPENYKKVSLNKNERKIFKRDLIKPNNKALIVDTWAGIVGNAKTILPKYRGEIYLERKPKNQHQIFLMPIETMDVTEDVINYFKPQTNSNIRSLKRKSFFEKCITPIVEYFQDIGAIYKAIFQDMFFNK